ncbi:hypothetical protein BDR03DRAFT_649237 [Suillus americanus]|nr:hypothetical protein BDR03DRAFT_649237 [Suillus americanus]
MLPLPSYPNYRRLPFMTPVTEARRGSTQSSNSSDHKDHKSSTDSASLPLYEKGDKFRLMLIGNCTSEKAAILNELSGDRESLDPPPTAEVSVLNPTGVEHYLHNIDTMFENNSLLEISNWEGSGVDSEHESSAIQAFIANRLVHAIWYCVPSNLAQAEKFLSVPHQVPVIAVFTDLDRLMDEILSTMCTDVSKTYDPSSPQNQLPVSFIDAARESVGQQFEARYKTVLMQTPNPPDAVVAIPNSRKSAQGRNYLADLVQATTTSLRSGDELIRGPSGHRLEALFVAAQRADVDPKYQLSFLYGLPERT